MRYRIATAVVALVAMLGVAPTMAAPPSKNVAVMAPARNGSPSSTDKKFMADAAQGNLSEISLGQLAQQKGTPAVAKAGGRMIVDHTNMLTQLQGLALHQNVKLPTSPGIAQKALHGTLSLLRGNLFDKAYVDEMVKGHTNDIQAFKKEAATTHDAALRSLCDQALPTMEQHLSLFQNLKSKK